MVIDQMEGCAVPEAGDAEDGGGHGVCLSVRCFTDKRILSHVGARYQHLPIFLGSSARESYSPTMDSNNTLERVVTYSCLAAFVITFWAVLAAWFLG